MHAGGRSTVVAWHPGRGRWGHEDDRCQPSIGRSIVEPPPLPPSCSPLWSRKEIRGKALMVDYDIRQAVEEPIEPGDAVFWSTSKNALHAKGATPRYVLELARVRVNREDNSLPI